MAGLAFDPDKQKCKLRKPVVGTFKVRSYHATTIVVVFFSEKHS